MYSKSSRSILCVPEETIHEIILYLPLMDILQMFHVSKKFHAFCENRKFWCRVKRSFTPNVVAKITPMMVGNSLQKSIFSHVMNVSQKFNYIKFSELSIENMEILPNVEYKVHFNHQGESNAFTLVKRYSKKIHHSVSREKSFNDIKNQFSLLREKQIKKVHPNEMRIVNIYWNQSSAYTVLLRDHTTIGILDIIASGVVLPERILSILAVKTLRYFTHYNSLGLKFLHFNPSNLVFDYNGRLRFYDRELIMNYVGFDEDFYENLRSIKYYSPEDLLGCPEPMNKSINWQRKKNIFELGMTIAALTLGEFPFKFLGNNKQQLYREYIQSLNSNIMKNNKFPQRIKEFILACTHIEPEKRFETEQLLNLPFLERYAQTNESHLDGALQQFFYSVNNFMRVDLFI